MEKVSIFIRKTNLKLCRKLKVIPITEVAKRYLIDGNAKYFSACSEDTHSNTWGLFIEKNNGKYRIVHWSNYWNEENGQETSEEKVQVTSDYRKVIKAINAAIDEDYGYDCWWAKDSHHTNVDWEVIRDPSDLYDDTEEVDVGELPEGFKPVEELEPVPEEIKL
jgi:hypothetical protein